jgi:hypothetical protein
MTLKLLIAVVLFAALSTPGFADRMLDREAAEKLEIRHSMLGFRDTLLFYVFEDAQAILVLSISNKDESFPVTGKIYLFDKATSVEGLKKWINNQHSDGLFFDPPKPIFTGELPKGSCKVRSHKQTGTSANPGPAEGTFKEFTVEFSIQEHDLEKKFKLSSFTDTARVHVEMK